MTEAVMRRKKEFYYDYNMDALEENATFVTERMILTNDLYGLYGTLPYTCHRFK